MKTISRWRMLKFAVLHPEKFFMSRQWFLNLIPERALKRYLVRIHRELEREVMHDLKSERLDRLRNPSRYRLAE
jgi:hypothetical protein